MQCTNPFAGVYPCGKCLACKIAKSREWSSRLLQELPYWHKAVFVTLTYDDEHLPSDFGLHKDELQKFFKRVRKRCDKLGIKIRYYACGEYGDHPPPDWWSPTIGRPHYHAIIFGLGNDNQSKEIIKDSWTFCQWSNFRDKKAFGTVTYDSCRYVADYIFKKYSNQMAVDVYGELLPPFKIGSNGLGLRFCEDNADQLKREVGFTIKGVPVALPRYYVNKLGIELERQNDSEKWLNYAHRRGLDASDVGDLIAESRRQRKRNIEARMALHKKGSL